MVGDPNIDDIVNKTNISYRLKTIKTALADLKEDLFDYTNERLFIEMRAVYRTGMTMKDAAHESNKDDHEGDNRGNAYRTPLQIVQDDLEIAFEATPLMIEAMRDSGEWSDDEYNEDAQRAAYACVNESYGGEELKERWLEYTGTSSSESDEEINSLDEHASKIEKDLTNFYDELVAYGTLKLIESAYRIAPTREEFGEAVYETDMSEESGEEYAIKHAVRAVLSKAKRHMPLALYAIAQNLSFSKQPSEIDLEREIDRMMDEIVESERAKAMWKRKLKDDQ